LINSHAFLNTTISTKNRNFLIDVLFSFDIVAIIFFSIFYCYFEDIFYSKLDIKNIIRFIINFFVIVVFEKIDTSNAKSLNNLIRNFDIYVYIVISFTS